MEREGEKRREGGKKPCCWSGCSLLVSPFSVVEERGEEEEKERVVVKTKGGGVREGV